MYDDFDIYDEIYLLKSIKELSLNKFNKSEYYDIMSICGLNNGTFIVCLYYKESLKPLNQTKEIIYNLNVKTPAKIQRSKQKTKRILSFLV